MSQVKYKMSFTTGGLFHRESVELASLFLARNDWAVVREEVLAGNLLQARTLSTLRRLCSEIISRLETLDEQELTFLVKGSRHEQAHMIWVAVCRRYQFIAEFATEVLRERFISLKGNLNPEDFDAFFNARAQWHPEVEAIRPATREKLRQVLFKMLRDADLLTSNNTINAALLTPEFIRLMSTENRQELFYFPVFGTEF